MMTYTSLEFFYRFYKEHLLDTAQSAGKKNTLTAYLQKSETTTSSLDTSFSKCGVDVHWHYSQAYSDPEWYYFLGSNLWVKWNV